MGLKKLTSSDSLFSLLKEGIVDAFWISSPVNIRYLTGFTGTSAYLLLVGEEKILITDKRYEERAKKELSDSKVEIEVADNSYLKTLNELLLKKKVKILGVEANNMSYLTFLNARRALKAKLLPFNTESLRMAKKEEEIKKIKKAIEISEKAFLEVLNKIKPGVEEREISFWLESSMKEKGAERVAFDIIVASGKRSSMPHAQTSRQKVRKGEIILIDWGAVYEGYHADITRMLVLGKPTLKQKEIFSLVKEAQDFALYSLKKYKRGKTVYEKVKKFFSERNKGEGFMHALGHGIGLEIHESPRLGGESRDIIAPGMVFTLEPALYFPGFFGMRLEDDFIMRKGYIERITSLPQELIEV